MNYNLGLHNELLALKITRHKAKDNTLKNITNEFKKLSHQQLKNNLNKLSDEDLFISIPLFTYYIQRRTSDFQQYVAMLSFIIASISLSISYLGGRLTPSLTDSFVFIIVIGLTVVVVVWFFILDSKNKLRNVDLMFIYESLTLEQKSRI